MNFYNFQNCKLRLTSPIPPKQRWQKISMSTFSICFINFDFPLKVRGFALKKRLKGLEQGRKMAKSPKSPRKQRFSGKSGEESAVPKKIKKRGRKIEARGANFLKFQPLEPSNFIKKSKKNSFFPIKFLLNFMKNR